KLFDQHIIRVCLPPRKVHVEREQRNQRDDRNIVRRGEDFPQLFPIHGYFRVSLISDSRTTGAGPEMPPSFRTRQKCTTMKISAMMGMPMQCQMYERSSAFASTIDPPSKPKRTSLYG